MAQLATDEIIEEIHAIRLEHAARFDFDIARIIDDLRTSERAHTEEGWPLVHAPEGFPSPNKVLQRTRFSRR